MSLRSIPMVLALAVGCGGGTSQDPDCDSIAGMWDIDGTCGDDLCTITQNGCAITGVSCTSGARSTSGSLDADEFSYTGTSGAGLPATCSGTVDGDALAGSCTAVVSACAPRSAARPSSA